jgi:subfamily B ATP-binding cassette protein HlyB/CyaB
MILQYYRIPANLQNIAHEYTAVSGRVTQLDIVHAAKILGLRAKVVNVPTTRLSKMNVPAISVNQNGDYYVIARVSDEKVLVQKPGHQPETVAREEFLQSWDGGAILLTPRDEIKSLEKKFDVTWFIPVVVKYRKIFKEVLLASLFIQLFALISPFFFQVIIDKVLAHRGVSTLNVLVLALIIIGLFEVILNGLRAYVFSHTTSRIDVELGAKLYKHLLGLPISYFESRQTGQIIARVRELESIRDFLTSNAITVALDALFIFVFLFALFHFSVQMTWIVIGFLPVFFIISLFITPILRARVEEQFQRSAKNQSLLVESVTGAETIKAMATEPQMRSKWEMNLSEYVKSSLKTVRIATWGRESISLVNKLMMAVLLWYGATLVLAGAMTVGMLIAFNMIVRHVTGPILRLSQLWQDFQQFRISIDRLGDVLNIPTEPSGSISNAALPPILGDIHFDRVVFRYDSNGPEIIKAIDLSIGAGQIVGIVGRSGSGKSTLTKLIQRLYVPESGRITVDGHDIRLIDTAWLRNQIGVVLQENYLFTGTVKENISMAYPTASMEQIISVAITAGAHDFILKLKDGYDTVLYERGTNLSGGQRQRIAIARALITSPRILIFDEATSALDYESERIIQKNMKDIAKDRTVIVIAHRLSTVRSADVIITMDDGAIVEQGSHQELIKQDGIYNYLYRQQVKDS